MGTWGFSVLEDDAAADVYARYIDLFNRGTEHSKIVAKITRENPSFKDDDERSVAWYAIAKAQWDCGALQPAVRQRVENLIASNDGMGRWEEAGSKSVAKRRAALTTFLSKLETSNPRPKKPRKAIKRKAIFKPGDCLAVKLSDGDWGAALVLQGEPESDDPFVDTYGLNLIGLLKYKRSEQPGLEVFRKREWLHLTHHMHKGAPEVLYIFAQGFRQAKDRYVVVGEIELRPEDPREPRGYTGWGFEDQVVLQDKWDRGIRD